MLNKFKIKIDFPFFALFFGIFPFMVLWAQNKLQVSSLVVFPVFLISLASVILVWLLICLLFRSFTRGSYFSLFLFLLFFSFGHVYNLLKGRTILGIEVGYVKLFLVYLLLFLVGLIVFLRKKTHSKSTTVILNILSVFLVGINLVQVIVFQVQRSSRETGMENTEVTQPVSSDDRPNIYYIILDAYAREDFLEKVYGFDNSAFLEELEQRGFQVADCSNSNYDGTLSSIASSLNYEYLNFYDIPDDDLSVGSGNIVSLIGNNQVRQDLAQFGYKFVTTRGYSSFNDVRDSDLYLNVLKDPAVQFSLQRSQLSRLFLSTTLLRMVFEIYTSNPSEYPYIPYWFELSSDNEYLDSSTFWYNQTRYVFDELKKIPGTDGNYFVYAHINAPHGPYVFDREGNFRYIKPTDDKKEYYVDTVIYINSRILDLVDTLISSSSVPPVIVLQADHGSHIVASGFGKHEILNAYYLPGSNYTISDTITPVNTFRIILNEYFDFDLAILPNEIYVKRLNKREIFPSQCDYGN